MLIYYTTKIIDYKWSDWRWVHNDSSARSRSVNKVLHVFHRQRMARNTRAVRSSRAVAPLQRSMCSCARVYLDTRSRTLPTVCNEAAAATFGNCLGRLLNAKWKWLPTTYVNSSCCYNVSWVERRPSHGAREEIRSCWMLCHNTEVCGTILTKIDAEYSERFRAVSSYPSMAIDFIYVTVPLSDAFIF